MFKLDPLPQWSDRISFSYNRGIPIISVGIHQYNYNTEMLVSAYYTLSGLLSVSHSLLTTPLNSLWGCHCYSSSRMRGQGHRWLKCPRNGFNSSWQWVETYAETSLGNAYSIPQWLLALIFGSPLNWCCFKRQNEKEGIPDHYQLAWSAKAFAGGWSISWALGSGLVLRCLPQKM